MTTFDCLSRSSSKRVGVVFVEEYAGYRSECSGASSCCLRLPEVGCLRLPEIAWCCLMLLDVGWGCLRLLEVAWGRLRLLEVVVLVPSDDLRLQASLTSSWASTGSTSTRQKPLHADYLQCWRPTPIAMHFLPSLIALYLRLLPGLLY